MLKKLLVSEKMGRKRRKVIFCFLVFLRDGGCRWYLIFCFQHAFFRCFSLLPYGLYELNRSLINHAWFKRHCWIFSSFSSHFVSFGFLLDFLRTIMGMSTYSRLSNNTITLRMRFHCSLLKLRKIFSRQRIIDWISLFLVCYNCHTSTYLLRKTKRSF